MSLYGLDESVRSLLKLDRFSAVDFSTKQFLEKLSASQAGDGSSVNRGLDPKPYIRTFEAVAGELQRLHDIASHQEEVADRETQKLNQNRNEDLRDLATNVDRCVEIVRQLDEETGELALTTGPLGDRLELLARQHEQIVDARQLVSAYLSFLRRGQSPELSRLWSSTASGDRRRCAQMVGQLQTLAQKIGPLPNNKEIESQIDKFAEQVETGLIEMFQEAYHVFDLSGMREIASILYDFNGGTSVVQAYVNQHDFFMQVRKQLDTSDELGGSSAREMVWRELGDPDSDYPEFRKIFEQLVSEIVSTAIQETEVIAKVFPNPVQVLSVFLQRIFAQRIQGLVIDYLREAQSLIPKSHHLILVRVLYVCYSQIKGMITSLKEVWSRPKFGLSVYSQSELSAVLDSNFDDTFGLFLDDYFANEILALKQIVRSTFHEFHEHHGVGDLSRGYANGGGHQRTLSRDSDHTIASPVPNSAVEDDNNTLDRMDRWVRAARFRLRSGPDQTGSSNNEVDLTQDRSSGNLDTASMQRVLAAFAECISRQQILRTPSWWAHDAVQLFNFLLTEVGGGYINVAVDSTHNQKSNQDGRQPIDWSFLEVVKGATRSLQLLSVFVKTALFAMVRNDKAASDEMAQKLNEYVSSVQDQCTSVIEIGVDLVHLRTTNLLSQQRKKDFSEPENPQAVSAIASEICAEFEVFSRAVRQSLSPENTRRLLKVVAENFYDDWTAHVSKFTVSPTGGQALSADTAAYERLLVHDWSLPELVENFATLRTIAKVFTVDPSLLPSLMRDSHLSKLRSTAVRGFLAQRADYQSKGVGLMFLNNMHTKYW